jgi:hypothetical protein
MGKCADIAGNLARLGGKTGRIPAEECEGNGAGKEEDNEEKKHSGPPNAIEFKSSIPHNKEGNDKEGKAKKTRKKDHKNVNVEQHIELAF